MKKYRVNVNGTDYEITLEEVTGAEASKPAAPAPQAAPAPAVAQPARPSWFEALRRWLLLPAVHRYPYLF